MSQKHNACESPRAGEHSQGFAQATIDAAYACANASDRTYFVYSGDTCEAIPLVAATFTPPRYPIVPVFFLYVRAKIDASPRNTGLVALVECSGIHIALLSSHRVCPRGRLGHHRAARWFADAPGTLLNSDACLYRPIT